MISYSTNWMGPISMNWFRQRGLTKKQEPRWSELLDRMITPEDITEQWMGGRIDVRGTDNPYGDELGLPIMNGKSYGAFDVWLRSFKTEEMWSLDQLVEEYEKTHPKIVWWEEP